MKKRCSFRGSWSFWFSTHAMCAQGSIPVLESPKYNVFSCSSLLLNGKWTGQFNHFVNVYCVNEKFILWSKSPQFFFHQWWIQIFLALGRYRYTLPYTPTVSAFKMSSLMMWILPGQVIPYSIPMRVKSKLLQSTQSFYFIYFDHYETIEAKSRPSEVLCYLQWNAYCGSHPVQNAQYTVHGRGRFQTAWK